MSEVVYTYALTSLQRVKDLLFDPNSTIAITGTTTSSSTSVTSVSSLTNVLVGMVIQAVGIPAGTTITAASGTTITLSQAATASGSGVALTVINQPPAFDTVLSRDIDSATDFIERETGGRRFLQTQYINEIYTATTSQQKRLVLRQFPVTYIFLAGDATLGSTSLANCSNVNGAKAGMFIISPGVLPSSTTIVSISGTTITLSAAAIATQTAAQCEINGLTSFQYRAGTPVTNPAWTSFIADQFELKNQGRSGIIRVYGIIPRIFDNMLRVSYWAGYLINWNSAGDNLTHTLPADITRVAENLVVRRFKRRAQGGKGSETLGGAAVSWDKELDVLDKETLSHYKRIPIII